MPLTVYRKYDLYRGFQPVLIVAAIGCATFIAWATGINWLFFPAVFGIVVAYDLPGRIGFRCPRCLAHLDEEGMVHKILSGWTRRADTADGEGGPSGSPEYCGVCGLDFTETTKTGRNLRRPPNASATSATP